MRSRVQWAPLADYEGHEISTRGEVRHIRKNTILKTSVNETGVRYVSIRNTTLGKYQNVALGQLVAKTFHDSGDRFCDTVLHLDGDTLNIDASNVMWASRAHAIAFHKEMADERYHQHARVRDGDGKRYLSLAAAARATGCLPSSIEYAIRYNSSLADSPHENVMHRIQPGGHIFTA